MSNPNPDQSGLEKGKWKPGQSGNPAGKPKGAKHLSTHIQEMLNDPDFELKMKTGEILKGRPIEAIMKTAIAKGISGNVQWAEWLAKHGYGNKLIIETGDPVEAALKKMGLLDDGENKSSKD